MIPSMGCIRFYKIFYVTAKIFSGINPINEFKKIMRVCGRFFIKINIFNKIIGLNFEITMHKLIFLS